jgi:predicted transcriptional regulator of viral defense system
MNYQAKIIRHLNQNSVIITTEWMNRQKIPRIYLTRLVNEGILNRISREFYSSESDDYDEYYFLQKQKPRFIFSYTSALHLLEITNLIPQQIEVTVCSGYNIGELPENVKVHYVKKDLYELGITQTNTNFGNCVTCYGIERTICDLPPLCAFFFILCVTAFYIFIFHSSS